MHKLFVYGTLLERINPFNHLLEENSVGIFNAYTYGKMYSLGHYPAITTIGRTHNDKIYGRLYMFDDHQILEEIDVYEGYDPNNIHCLYIRQEETVYTENGPVIAMAYVMDDVEHFTNTRIESGNWLEWKRNHKNG